MFGGNKPTGFGTPFASGTLRKPQSGTTLKFNPPQGQDTMVKNGVTQNVNTKHQCITAMKEYKNKSLEELRMEDYLANRKGKQGVDTGFGFGTSSSTSTQSTGFAFGKAKPTGIGTSNFGATPSSTGGLVGQKTTANTGGLYGTPAASTTNVFSFGGTGGFGATMTTANTGGLFGACNTSTGELFGSSAFGKSQSGTTLKFNPPQGKDTMEKNGVTQNINTKHQCITAMKEYENKSLEELRVEDDLANRKGKQGGGTGYGFGTSSSTSTQSTGFAFGQAKPTEFGTSNFGATPSSTGGQVGQKTTANTGGLYGTPAASTTNVFSFGGTGGFGATTTTASTGGLFGASNTSTGGLFGSSAEFGTSTAARTGLFGQPSTHDSTGGLFGQNKPLFGATTTTAQSGFGFGNTTTGTYRFGNTQANKDKSYKQSNDPFRYVVWEGKPTTRGETSGSQEKTEKASAMRVSGNEASLEERQNLRKDSFAKEAEDAAMEDQMQQELQQLKEDIDRLDVRNHTPAIKQSQNDPVVLAELKCRRQQLDAYKKKQSCDNAEREQAESADTLRLKQLENKIEAIWKGLSEKDRSSDSKQDAMARLNAFEAVLKKATENLSQQDAENKQVEEEIEKLVTEIQSPEAQRRLSKPDGHLAVRVHEARKLLSQEKMTIEKMKNTEDQMQQELQLLKEDIDRLENENYTPTITQSQNDPAVLTEMKCRRQQLDAYKKKQSSDDTERESGEMCVPGRLPTTT